MKHEGMFKAGHITGIGKYTGSDGELKEGQFLDGLLHGPGRWITSRGERYEGNFHHGAAHRQAMCTNPRRKKERCVETKRQTLMIDHLI